MLEKFWTKFPHLNTKENREVLTNKSSFRTIYLKLETINICNNLCVICAYRDQERLKSVMPLYLYRKVLEDYSEMGGGFLSFTPLVGDVLLDKHLIERLEMLDQFPSINDVGVTTNAVMSKLYSDEQLNFIVNKFKRISISVYGLDNEEYELMTQRKTYYDMLEGIRRIAGFSGNAISLELRLLKKRSESELDQWLQNEILSHLPDEKYSNIRINSVINDYANWGIYNEVNTPLPFDAKWFKIEKQIAREQCMIPLLTVQVFSNGNISFCPCDNFNDIPELRLGNIIDESLKTLCNSKRAEELWDWDKYGTPEFCQSCSFHIPMKFLEQNPSIITNPHPIVGAG